MHLVIYTYYDDFSIDSVWYSEELAQARADELNVRDRCKTKPRWGVEYIRIGDELE